jgi:hypothetical protein
MQCYTQTSSDAIVSTIACTIIEATTIHRMRRRDNKIKMIYCHSFRILSFTSHDIYICNFNISLILKRENIIKKCVFTNKNTFNEICAYFSTHVVESC